MAVRERNDPHCYPGIAYSPSPPAAAHTHAQSEITNLVSDLAAKEDEANKGAINGYAGLDGAGLVPVAQLPGLPAAWGTITGVLSAQTDLQSALDAKLASASYTAADVLAKLLTVDGAGSGVDADLLDGNSSAAFATATHATQHKSGGGDAIKLDELASPTDVTTLNSTTAEHGLLRKLDGLTTTFLRGDGTWASPAGGGSGDTILYKAADQSISAAGWVDISDLTFAVAASKAYHIDALVVFRTSTTAMGAWFGFNGPASPSLASILFEKEITAVATAGTDKMTCLVGTAYDTGYPTQSTSEVAQNTNLMLRIRGVFVNGGNAGTFALRLNKENVAGTGTVMTGSFLKYRVMN